MNPKSHIPHLQAQLAFAWHNRFVLDRRLSAVSWYSPAPSPPLRDDTKVFRGQSPSRTDITFYVLVTLVDTMRLYGIQSPDPVALTSFSSIIRPLMILVSLCCTDHDAQYDVFHCVFFVLSLFRRDVLDEIWDLIESVSEGFPTYFWFKGRCFKLLPVLLCLSDGKKKNLPGHTQSWVTTNPCM